MGHQGSKKSLIKPFLITGAVIQGFPLKRERKDERKRKERYKRKEKKM